MTTTATPQRLAHLELANGSRLERAALRRGLRDGTVTLPALIEDPPRWLHSMLLFDLARLAPRMGRTKLARLNVRAMSAGVNLAMPLGTSCERSRKWLAEALR